MLSTTRLAINTVPLQVILSFNVYCIVRGNTAMLSRILISLIIVNVFTHLTMASEQQLACVKKDTAGHKTEQIKSIGDYILKQLGYTEAPNASSQPIPEDKLTDYRMQNQRARVHEKCDVIKGSNAVSVSTIPGKPLHPQGASKPGSESDNTKRGMYIFTYTAS